MKAIRSIRRLEWLLGVIWALSWLELYLEIYRHHHVAPAFLGVTLAPELRPGSHPGGWLLTVLTTSVSVPLLMGGVALWTHRQSVHASRDTYRAGFAWGLIVIGVAIALFGGINQFVQGTTLQLDLTLRRGSGGFVVDGLVLALAGGIIQWRRRNKKPREALPSRAG